LSPESSKNIAIEVIHKLENFEALRRWKAEQMGSWKSLRAVKTISVYYKLAD